MPASYHEDGVLRTWLDGELVGEETEMLWRLYNNVTVSFMHMSTFFGGSDRTWASPQDQVCTSLLLRMWQKLAAVKRRAVCRCGPAGLPPIDHCMTPHGLCCVYLKLRELWTSLSLTSAPMRACVCQGNCKM